MQLAHGFGEGSPSSPLSGELWYQRTGVQVLQLLVQRFCLLRMGVETEEQEWEEKVQSQAQVSFR